MLVQELNHEVKGSLIIQVLEMIHELLVVLAAQHLSFLYLQQEAFTQVEVHSEFLLSEVVESILIDPTILLHHSFLQLELRLGRSRLFQQF